MDKTRSSVINFIKINGSKSRIISFAPQTLIKLPDIEEIEMWRDLISADEERAIQKEAYVGFNNILEIGGETLWCNRNILFFFMCQTIFIKNLLKTIREPICLILPGSSKSGFFSTEGAKSLGRMISEMKCNIQEKEDDIQKEYGKKFKNIENVCFVFKVYLNIKISLKYFSKMLKPKDIKDIKDIKDVKDVLVLADSGSSVNLNPALDIARQLESSGGFPYILTHSEFVKESMESNGFNVTKINFENLPIDLMFNTECEVLGLIKRLMTKDFLGLIKGLIRKDLVYRFFIAYIHPNFFSWARDNKIFQYQIGEFFNLYNARSFLTIGLAEPLTILAAKEFKDRKGIWTNYLPILINDSLEAFFYPADQYLVYGDHAKEIIISSGKNPDDVFSFGSTGLDRVINGNFSKVRDKKWLLNLYPEVGNDKIIILGTEFRPNEFTEIKQILNELIKIPESSIILKLHPDEQKAQFENLLNQSCYKSITLIQSCDIDRLINAADLLICSASNINLNAALHKTPSLSIVLSGKPYRINFNKEGLCPSISKKKDIKPVVQSLLFDSSEIKKSLKMYDKSMYRFNGPNDGKAVKRIVEVLIGKT